MSKTVTGFRRAHCLAPVAGGGGYLEGRPVLVNPAFSASFRRPPEEPENIRKRIDPRPLRHRQTQVIQGISSVRPGGDPSEEAAV